MSPSCDDKGSPYLGEGFEPQCCDNCPRGCAHIGCSQLAERAGSDTSKPGSPYPSCPSKERNSSPFKSTRIPGLLSHLYH